MPRGKKVVSAKASTAKKTAAKKTTAKKVVAKKVAAKKAPAKKLVTKKAQTKKSAQIIVLQTAEKAFEDAKSGLVKQFEKALNALQKTEKTLKAKLQKADAKKKAAKDKRVAAAQKAKGKTATKAGIARFEKAKVAYDVAADAVDAIKKEFAALKESLSYLKVQSKKYQALNKLLNKFEKDWHKKVTAKKPAKTRKKVASKAKKAPVAKVIAGISKPINTSTQNTAELVDA